MCRNEIKKTCFSFDFYDLYIETDELLSQDFWFLNRFVPISTQYNDTIYNRDSFHLVKDYNDLRAYLLNLLIFFSASSSIW